MMNVYGRINLTVVGPEDEMRKVEAMIREQEYKTEQENRLRDMFLAEWLYVMWKAETNRYGNMKVRRAADYDPAHVALQLIQKIGDTFPLLTVAVEGEITAKYQVMKMAVGDWDGDVQLFGLIGQEADEL